MSAFLFCSLAWAAIILWEAAMSPSLYNVICYEFWNIWIKLLQILKLCIPNVIDLYTFRKEILKIVRGLLYEVLKALRHELFTGLLSFHLFQSLSFKCYQYILYSLPNNDSRNENTDIAHVRWSQNFHLLKNIFLHQLVLKMNNNPQPW